jgi:hypothetical protein
VHLLGRGGGDPIQGRGALEGGVVGPLSLSEAAAVDAVVDGGVHPLVHLVDCSPQCLGVQVQLRVLSSSSTRSRSAHRGGATCLQ